MLVQNLHVWILHPAKVRTCNCTSALIEGLGSISVSSFLLSNTVRHVVDPATNKEHAGGGQCERDGDGGDHVVAALEVRRPVHALEVPLLLHDLLPWPEGRLRLRRVGR